MEKETWTKAQWNNYDSWNQWAKTDLMQYDNRHDNAMAVLGAIISCTKDLDVMAENERDRLIQIEAIVTAYCELYGNAQRQQPKHN